MAQAAVVCPFCASDSAELISLFGSQLLLSQYRCTACRTYFEGIRPDRADVNQLAPGRADSGGTIDDGHRVE